MEGNRISKSGASTPKHGEIAGLDLLRLVAACLVVSYHYLFFAWVEPKGGAGLRDLVGDTVRFPEAVSASWFGWIGVEVFFVISGFVITRSATGKTAAAFAAGRLSRLFPTLIFFATVSLIIVLSSTDLPWPFAMLRWLRTITLFPVGPWIDGVIWTLTVEAVFYVLVYCCLLVGGKTLHLVSRAAIVVLSLFWLAVAVNTVVGLGSLGSLLWKVATAYAARTALLTTGSFFLVGIFGYEIHRSGLSVTRAMALAFGIFDSIAAIAARASQSPGVVEFHQNALTPILVWCVCLGIGALVLIIERRRPPGLGYRRFARYVGLSTYPLYLVHEMTGGWLLGTLYLFGLNRWIAVAVTVATMMVVSVLFAILVEPAVRRALHLPGLEHWARSRSGLAPRAGAAVGG